MSASQSAPSEFSVTCSPRKRIAHLCKCLSNEHAPEPIDRTDGWLGQALDFTGHSRVMTYQLISKSRSSKRAESVLKQTVCWMSACIAFSPAVKKKFKGFPIKTLTETFEDLPKGGGSHTMYMIHELPTEDLEGEDRSTAPSLGAQNSQTLSFH
ncbi:hypothetical protein NFJ02_08g135300 [Pycnococcus provasolii]